MKLQTTKIKLRGPSEDFTKIASPENYRLYSMCTSRAAINSDHLSLYVRRMQMQLCLIGTAMPLLLVVNILFTVGGQIYQQSRIEH